MRPADLAGQACALARELAAAGVGTGDRVALWLQSGDQKVAAILATWMIGAAFCVLPSFAGRVGSDLSQARVDAVLSVLAPRVLVQDAAAPLPAEATAGLPTITMRSQAFAPGDPLRAIAARDPQDLAFVQFTSGSTGGTAKGAEVRFCHLEANLAALAARTGLAREDRMVSWAPLYHDMGLMAVLLSLRFGVNLALIETEFFVRRPSIWLESISAFAGTMTTAPPTALKLLTRRRAAGVNLASLRYAWIGGEAVFPVVLREFEATYADAGLRSGVLQPTYGMAETVVGISCGVPGALWVAEQGITCCGPPLDGIDLCIAGEDDTPLPAGQEGRILVRGASVISGYLGQERYREGAWFDTGDLGFVKDGRVFVSGRRKDVLKRGAESFPATLVETVAEEALRLNTGRVAAFSSPRPDIGKEEIVLLVESRDWDDDRARLVAAAVLRELGLQADVIRAAIGGRLPRTSSGKLMRQLAAAQYREGLI